jgi:hypothetical protein
MQDRQSDAGRILLVLVREGGVEPPRPLGHTDLNRARLPIPPLARAACRLPRRPSRSRSEKRHEPGSHQWLQRGVRVPIRVVTICRCAHGRWNIAALARSPGGQEHSTLIGRSEVAHLSSALHADHINAASTLSAVDRSAAVTSLQPKSARPPELGRGTPCPFCPDTNQRPPDAPEVLADFFAMTVDSGRLCT